METEAKKDAPEAAPEADVVTKIQDHIALICARFYNFIGALQRDAPPAPLHGETIPDERHEHLEVDSVGATLFKSIFRCKLPMWDEADLRFYCFVFAERNQSYEKRNKRELNIIRISHSAAS